MTRARGNVLQNALADYLTECGWMAEPVGAGRQGSDILGIPGTVWECKTANDFKRDWRPQQWVDQSKKHAANGEKPFTVYFPPGIGAMNVANTISLTPVHVQVQLLKEAGYC